MNKIIFAGKVVSDPQFSHEIYNKKYYEFYISSQRISGTEDIARCILQEDQVKGIKENDLIEVEGRLISRRVYNGKFFQSEAVIKVSNINEYVTDINVCEIWGNIRVAPVIRETKSGKLLADFSIWSKRENIERYDQIPCLAWGEMGLEAAEFSVGNSIHVVGRFQSRYNRKYDKTVYEVSVPRNGELERWEN